LRRRLPDKKFTRAVGFAIAEETLKIIQSLHCLGIVHRDIKPSNFLLRPRSNAPLCLIDFGLARRYIDPATKRPFLAACVSRRFTGTVKYASPNAHRGMNLGPRDNLFSWFYSLVEMMGNPLPWEDVKDQEQCGAAKDAIAVDELCANMPPKFDVMYRAIAAFTYEATCDYRRIFGLLSEGRAAEQIRTDGTEFNVMMNIIPEAMEIVPDVTEQLKTGATVRTPLIGDPEGDSPNICPGCCVI
jgi:serine/threonine protein kinase